MITTHYGWHRRWFLMPWKWRELRERRSYYRYRWVTYPWQTRWETYPWQTWFAKNQIVDSPQGEEG